MSVNLIKRILSSIILIIILFFFLNSNKIIFIIKNFIKISLILPNNNLIKTYNNRLKI